MTVAAIVNTSSGNVEKSFLQWPERVEWPGGDVTQPAVAGAENGRYRFVAVQFAPERPSEFYNVSSEKPSLDGNTLTYRRTWSPLDLDTVKADLKARVDATAETIRLQYITGGSGQAMTYQEKFNEARAFSADQSPDPSNYPLLSACIGSDGDDLAGVAQTVLGAFAAWKQIGAQIEGIRRRAATAISAASTVDEAAAAFQAVKWAE